MIQGMNPSANVTLVHTPNKPTNVTTTEPIVVASPVDQAPAVATADAGSDDDRKMPAITTNTQDTNDDTNNAVAGTPSPASDSEYDADVVSELRRNTGLLDPNEKPKIKPAPKPNDYGRRTNRLGPLQLPTRHVAHDLAWTAYMPNDDISGYSGQHRWTDR